MKTETKPLTHFDHADAAEAAQRGGAWPQAATLWRRAIHALAAVNQAEFLRHWPRYADAQLAAERKGGCHATEPVEEPQSRGPLRTEFGHTTVDVWGRQEPVGPHLSPPRHSF